MNQNGPTPQKADNSGQDLALNRARTVPDLADIRDVI